MIESTGFLRWVILVVTVWVGLTSIRSIAAHGAPKGKSAKVAKVVKVGKATKAAKTAKASRGTASTDVDAMTGAIKKKRVIYRSHTQVDLSGETVQGKIRAPEVFYIFQRKRSQAHHVVQTPETFDYHTGEVRETLAEALPK